MIPLTLGNNQFVLYLVKMFISLAQRLVQVLSLRIRMGEKKQGKIPRGFRHLKIFFSRLVDLRSIFTSFRLRLRLRLWLWCPTTTTAKTVTCNALKATLPWVIGINSGGTRSTSRNDLSARPSPARKPFPTRKTCAATGDPFIQKSRTCASTANMSNAITAAMVRTMDFHVKTTLIGTRKLTYAHEHEMTTPNDQDMRDHNYQRIY